MLSVNAPFLVVTVVVACARISVIVIPTASKATAILVMSIFI